MISSEQNQSCKLMQVCSGCRWLGEDYLSQLHKKSQELLNTLKSMNVDASRIQNLDVKSGGEMGLRDKVDLTLMTSSQGRKEIGLYDMTGQNLVHMEACPQMSPALESFFKSFRANLPDIKLGSLRLRVAPNKTFGAWFDFANVDIKKILDERSWIEGLMNSASVEMGQKRKRVTLKSIDNTQVMKLTDPVLEPWFETFIGEEEKPTPLYCTIGSFTQPSFKANRVMVRELKNTLKGLPAKNWLELFSGIGNFTLPLASWGHKVTAYEIDDIAVEGLTRSLKEVGYGDDIVTVKRGDLYRKGGVPDPGEYEAILVDPPRSGLKGILTTLGELESSRRPNTVCYISCYTNSFCEDAKVLETLGYKITKLTGVDQFPQTPHCEWIALFERDK